MQGSEIAELLDAVAQQNWHQAADVVRANQDALRVPSPATLPCFNASLDQLSDHLGLPFFSLPGLLRIHADACESEKRFEGPLNAHPNAVHGTPITPASRLKELQGGSFCVSYFRPDQLEAVIPLLAERSVLIADNGAFSAYRSGAVLDDAYWAGYWQWAHDLLNRCPQAVAVIPDVIGGSAEENMGRIMEQRFSIPSWERRLMPVWHLNEPLSNLAAIYSAGYRYIAFGSCADYDAVGSALWDQRIDEAFAALKEACGAEADLLPRIHMMRGLGQLKRGRHAFTTADSTNIARNHAMRSKRGETIASFRQRIESYRFPVEPQTFPHAESNPDPRYTPAPAQLSIHLPC